jgi:cytidylate kinase
MRTVQQMIEEQVHRWQMSMAEKRETPSGISVISISREPGSGGRILATKLGEELGFDVFHQEVIHQMAQSANVNARLLETLDEKGVSVLEEAISAVVEEHHLWPDEYLKHLMKIIGVIGEHGGAVIVGRGANFILSPERCLRVRVVAPPSLRAERVCKAFGISKEECRRRLLRTESNRRAFVRKYFNANIAEPLNYDLIINTAQLDMERAVAIIRGSLGR